MVLGTGMPTRGLGIKERKKEERVPLKSFSKQAVGDAEVYFPGAVDDVLGKSAAPSWRLALEEATRVPEEGQLLSGPQQPCARVLHSCKFTSAAQILRAAAGER